MINREIHGQEPLVLFIGPASCGKSMVLMSLVEYLVNPNLGYTVDPDTGYIISADYSSACNEFRDTLRNNAAIQPGHAKKALDATINEIMVDVLDNHARRLRMLEAPGEDFFNLSNPGNPIKPYLNTIISKTRSDTYPVYYVMLLNINNGKDTSANNPLLNNVLRAAYENRLIEIYDQGYNPSRGDKVVLLYNKFDLHDSHMSETAAFDYLLDHYYPNIKRRFRGKFFPTPEYTYLAYITGKNYTDNVDDQGNSYQEYITDAQVTQCAADLWKDIKRWNWR